MQIKSTLLPGLFLLFLFGGCAGKQSISGSVPESNAWFANGQTDRYKIKDSIVSYVKVQKTWTSRVTNIHIIFELKIDTVLKDTVFTHFKILNFSVVGAPSENSSALKEANIPLKLLIDATLLKISIPPYLRDNYDLKIGDIIHLFFGFYPSRIVRNRGKWKRKYTEHGLTSEILYRLSCKRQDSIAVIKAGGHVKANRLKSVNVSDIHLKFSGTVKGKALWLIKRAIPLNIDANVRTKGLKQISSLMTGNISLPFRTVEHITIEHMAVGKADF